MSESLHTVTTMPTARQSGCPFDPPAELLQARTHGPISRYPFPGNHPGWLVTGYDLARAVLADSRFSSRKELMRHPSIDVTGIEIPPAPPGEFLIMDEPQHSRYRKPLVGKFTVRRMRQLTERIRQITDEHLDAMAAAGPPVDLVSAFAKPIPTIVICELLGVRHENREHFHEWAEILLGGEASNDEQMTAYFAINDYLAELVAAKRAQPTDDILSDLTDTDLSDEELRGIGLLLLVAGLDTTASTLSLGTFALLRNPKQLHALRTDPDLIDQAVEEILRYLSVAKTFMRTALEDVELGGHPIKAGDTVMVSYNTANRDPDRFTDPNVLDLSRSEARHLAFGHGIHQCLGQQLARVELRTAFPALFERFPTLRLAVEPEEVQLRSESADIYGAKSLPVTWDV
ncbi:cytochrome P450 [Nocardia panacis]|uniref:Cytochrome P450 n=1 Tax=Nocardia panacis TaxID=2340916 RepID=A0A3A4KD90_9NOCA|nr:cytochrome P450 [Nocardia panacis]RJO80048.1 cytochrome P450 [Nocardia panacis]